MHICVITIDYPSPGYPVYTFVEQLCVEFAKQGHEISVVVPQNIISILTRKRRHVDFIRRQQYSDGSITIYSPYTITGYSIPVIGKWINRIAGYVTRQYMRKHKINPDVYYSHFWRAGLWTYKEAKRNSKPFFVASGESSIALKNSSKYIDDYCNYVKGVICVSTKNKNESIKNGLTTEEKCVVIPNAIDNKLFYPKDKSALRKKLGFPEDAFIVAFVGYFSKRKGSDRLSEAIKLINDPEVKSIFIGTDRNENASPSCGGILFKGKVKHEEIPDYLNCADVFVLPTLHEGCCNAIIEAMACGLPVISSNRDFNYDVLDDTCSILIDPTSVEAIANAVKQIKDNVLLREKLSKGALSKAKDLILATRASRIVDFMNI